MDWDLANKALGLAAIFKSIQTAVMECVWADNSYALGILRDLSNEENQ